MHLPVASPFSLDLDTELQAVPFGQRFQTVPPKSDASALTEMAKKKGEGRFQFGTRHSTVQLTQSITNSRKLGETTRSNACKIQFGYQGHPIHRNFEINLIYEEHPGYVWHFLTAISGQPLH